MVERQALPPKQDVQPGATKARPLLGQRTESKPHSAVIAPLAAIIERRFLDANQPAGAALAEPKAAHNVDDGSPLGLGL